MNELGYIKIVNGKDVWYKKDENAYIIFPYPYDNVELSSAVLEDMQDINALFNAIAQQIKELRGE